MFLVYSMSYGPEIGNVDEGVVEGRKYAGYAEDEFTWWGWSVGIYRTTLSNLPSLTWGPREIFSCAGRAAFFGGMIVAGYDEVASLEFDCREIEMFVCATLILNGSRPADTDQKSFSIYIQSFGYMFSNGSISTEQSAPDQQQSCKAVAHFNAALQSGKEFGIEVAAYIAALDFSLLSQAVFYILPQWKTSW
jgi:hypothetical protein